MNTALRIILVILLTGCEQAEPVFNQLSPDAVILAFGDSLTYGTGATQNSDYPSVLSKISSHTIVNAGIPGEISRNGLSRLPDTLDEHEPELLILIHGGNDILRKIPPEQTRDNLSQMITLAKQHDIKVIMLGVPKPNLFVLNSAEIYQQIAEAHKVPTDLETLPEILSDNTLKSDTIHPNNEGYEVMAKNIFNLLVETGAL